MNRDRAQPRPWQTDWLMLRGMRRTFDRLAGVHLRNGLTLLDFGCGDQPYRQLVQAHGTTYIGADFGDAAEVRISPEGIVAAPDASVDVVLSVQVLEHVRDLDLYFAEIDRVLKKDGTLLLSTHGTWLYHPHPEDHRRWTRTGLVHDIEARGFTVREIEAIVGPLATTTMIRLTGFAFMLRRIPLVGGGIAAMLSMVMNARGWVEELMTPATIKNDNGCIYVTSCVKAAA